MTTSSATAEQQQVQWFLPAELVRSIETLAAAEGIDTEQIASQILSRGIADAGITPAGRCSLRTGLCSEGPTPLAIQQC